MKSLKNIAKKYFENKKGQGATEYILLLVVLVALVLALGPKIKDMVTKAMDKANSQAEQVQ